MGLILSDGDNRWLSTPGFEIHFSLSTNGTPSPGSMPCRPASTICSVKIIVFDSFWFAAIKLITI